MLEQNKALMPQNISVKIINICDLYIDKRQIVL